MGDAGGCGGDVRAPNSAQAETRWYFTLERGSAIMGATVSRQTG
jgi:hypothetical protein